MLKTVLCITLISMAFVTNSAQAQNNREIARRHYAEGQALFNAGAYEAALAEFRAAYDIAPHPVVLKSQAECLERLNRQVEAIQLLERYLAETPNSPEAREIRRRINAFRTNPAYLRIISNPPGATITIDGTLLNQRTPTTLEIQGGHHTILIQLQGYQVVMQELNLEPTTHQTIEANLVPDTQNQYGNRYSQTQAGYGGVGSAKKKVTTPVWIMIGLGAASVITGAVAGGLALADQDDFDDGVHVGHNRAELQELGHTGETKALITDISLGVAGAAALTGIILFFVQNSRKRNTQSRRRLYPSLSVAPTLTDGGGGLTALQHF